MNRKIVCTHCGDTFDADEMTSFGEEILCPDCLDELTVVCERCGIRIWAEDAADSDITLCDHCYDNYYTTCESCGRTIDTLTMIPIIRTADIATIRDVQANIFTITDLSLTRYSMAKGNVTSVLSLKLMKAVTAIPMQKSFVILQTKMNAVST